MFSAKTVNEVHVVIVDASFVVVVVAIDSGLVVVAVDVVVVAELGLIICT